MSSSMPIVQCQFVTLPRSVLNGDIAMCRFFTQLGVDVHATNNRGATPAEIGKSRHSAEVAAALGAPPMPAAPTLYVPHLPPLYFCNILRRYVIYDALQVKANAGRAPAAHSRCSMKGCKRRHTLQVVRMIVMTQQQYDRYA